MATVKVKLHLPLEGQQNSNLSTLLQPGARKAGMITAVRCIEEGIWRAEGQRRMGKEAMAERN